MRLPHLVGLVRLQRGALPQWKSWTERVRAARSDAEREAIFREGRQRGNPGRRHTVRKDILCAAWLADGLALSVREVAETLGFADIDDRALRRKGKAYVEDGRKLLNDAGVLPWTLWADGVVVSKWWLSPRFFAALNHWYAGVLSHRHEWDRGRELVARASDMARLMDGKQPRVSYPAVLPSGGTPTRAAKLDDAST